MKARVALDEDPGGQLIIRREGTRTAFLVQDLPPWSFSADASPAAWVADSRRRVELENSVSARVEGDRTRWLTSPAASPPSSAATQLQIRAEGT